MPFTPMRQFHDPAVAAKFEAYPSAVRRKLLALREVVFRTAASTPGVGELVETLKWGELAYATKDKTGSTLRMDWKSKDPGHYAMYFNCQTNRDERQDGKYPSDGLEVQGPWVETAIPERLPVRVSQAIPERLPVRGQSGPCVLDE